jgi:pimeloyl-ACP methyl ester carboxylesterase
MNVRLRFVLALCVALAACVSTPSQRGVDIATETFMIPALDPGIELHMRNKHAAGVERYGSDRIVLFVHGATFPSETGFDIDLPGGSWLDFVVRRGFDAYALDIRGYGRSTRPPAMQQPPEANTPFADTREAVRDVSAAVDFILKRRGVERLDLIGWSWGTTLMAGYAAENAGKVNKLVLYAPVWIGASPGPAYQGAYRTSTRDGVRPFATAGVPKDRADEINPIAWYDRWWSANLATDPVGAARNPPVVRSPNGALKDLRGMWGNGKPTYDAAAVRAPTLLVVGEWDAITAPAVAQELYKQLVGASQKRLVLLSEGSHFMAVEKTRMRLLREVQQFLEEPEE